MPCAGGQTLASVVLAFACPACLRLWRKLVLVLLLDGAVSRNPGKIRPLDVPEDRHHHSHQQPDC